MYKGILEIQKSQEEDLQVDYCGDIFKVNFN